MRRLLVAPCSEVEQSMVRYSGIVDALNYAMQEQFYRLVRQYLATVREFDVVKEYVRKTPESVEREQARRDLVLAGSRCKVLRREILQQQETGHRRDHKVGVFAQV
jgi:hypothetical protein